MKPALPPILEYDPDREALITPSHFYTPRDVPRRCVLCFFQDAISLRCARAPTAATIRTEVGRHPIYELDVGGRRVGVMHPGLGAPMGAMLLEAAIALGCDTFISCGGAGAVAVDLVQGEVVVATTPRRSRDPPRTSPRPPPAGAGPHPEVIAALEAELVRQRLPFRAGATWSTDAVYRETSARIERRRGQGCLVVEMEAAALFAVAQHRGVRLGQLFYAGDDVSGEAWEERGWQEEPIRGRLLEVALAAAARLD